ncbi:MAG: reverse transcriptase-like protein [Actinobacteria bacterium]|uniref:Unannotated protein n=1 Tax=freshwater metagenome TaxID=449393 RepID=A0A6J7ETF4_9ZZZZ|nr:reverse transcriptase-like protein [Actinomycetota bacterium]
MRLTLHCDGGSRGNPGPAGIGVVLTDDSGEVIAEVAERIGDATNNVAEYKAVIRGLERAQDLEATVVALVGDSELVAKQITGHYKVKHADMKPLHAEVKSLLESFDSWTIRTVPRAENSDADALVNAALDGLR